jgi:hypothetical protein
LSSVQEWDLKGQRAETIDTNEPFVQSAALFIGVDY